MKKCLPIFSFVLLILSCANIVVPSGGDRDKLPPNVIYSNPANTQTNFKENHIHLKFDEFVELDNPLKNISISPTINEPLKTKLVGRNLYILFSKELESNTTYSIQLNSAIKDFNEGNIMTNYKLKFSTGNIIDSSNLKVSSINNFNNTNSDKTWVVLTRTVNDFYNNQFRYMSPSTSGFTVLDNIDREKYYLFSFLDSNMNKKYDASEEVAFHNATVTKDSTMIYLNMFLSASDSVIFTLLNNNPNEYTLKSSKPIFNMTINHKDIVVIPENPNTYKLITNFKDSVLTTRVQYNDNKYETISLLRNKKPLDINILEQKSTNKFDVVRYDTVSFYFNSFINKLDTSKIILFKDTQEIKSKNITVRDNKLSISNLDSASSYKLIFDTFSINRNNKPIVTSFITCTKESYHKEMNIVIENYNSKKPLLAIIEDKNYLETISLKDAKINLKHQYKSPLKLRVVYDDNKNGIWDSGNIKKRIQPETTQYFLIPLVDNQNEYKINLK